MSVAMARSPIGMSWKDQGTSIRMDIFCLILALALHAPLIWIKLDFKKKTVDRKKERLVAIDLIDPEAPKPVAAPKPAKKKGGGLMAKLKALVKKEPPPPPKKLKKIEQPKKLALAPKEIKLQPKLKMPDKMAPKLKTKAGFKTKADPKLVKEKQISLKAMGAGIAPLSQKRLGIQKNRNKIKSKKGFVAASNSLSGIAGAGPGLADPSAPTIAIKTSKKGSVEKFSAPPPSMSNKGKFGGAGAKSLVSGKKLGLRDQIIARQGAPIAVGNSNRSRAGGPSGPVATKRNAGSFGSGSGGGGGTRLAQPGSKAGRRTQLASIKKAPAIRAKKKKKSMFTITGELKNRKILKQVIPKYPLWAQNQGIEAAVVLKFTVTPSGKVKMPIVVSRTSGYAKLDASAKKALSQWKFIPLSDINREEVGYITFNYTLS